MTQIVQCSTCETKIERRTSNGRPFKCWDCKQKDRVQRTRDWYRKPGNKERKLAWLNAKVHGTTNP